MKFVEDAPDIVFITDFAAPLTTAHPSGEYAVGQLDQFYPDLSVWGEGVGRTLMAAAIETLRESGLTALSSAA